LWSLNQVTGVDYLECYHVLHWVADLIKPRSYLEVGVREGASLCCVLGEEHEIVDFAMQCLMDGRTTINDEIVERVNEVFTNRNLEMQVYLFDDWSHVKSEGGHSRVAKLLRDGFKHVNYKIFDGDSKETLPEFFKSNPSKIDLVYIDGDHSLKGVWSDLNNVTGRFKVLVVHDLYHPEHEHVVNVFIQYVKVNRFPSFIVGRHRLGVGVAFDLQ